MALRYLSCSFSFLVMALCLLAGEKPGSVELLKVGGGWQEARIHPVRWGQGHLFTSGLSFLHIRGAKSSCSL